MKKINWRLLIAGMVLMTGVFPITAFADQGVMLESYEIIDENGKVIKGYERGDRITMVSEDEEGFMVSIDHKRYPIEKKAIMKTVIEKEVAISVEQEEAKLRLIPSLFSQPIQTLKKGEILERIPGATNEEFWLQVKTKEGIIGFIFRDMVEIHYDASESLTKAYIVKEVTKDERFFDYGEEISLKDYYEGHFVVKSKDKEYLIPASHISFQKPLKPLVLTPSNTYPMQLKVYGNPDYIPPVNMKNPPVSSRYGMRWGKLHAGTDLAIMTGTPLYAVADGVVTRAVKNQTHSKVSWGNYVKIAHSHNEDSLYGHMSKVVVSPGQHVKQGQLIGYSGNSGDSTGQHLHFELYKNGIRMDSFHIVHQPELYR